jgi:hypothetical protein
MLIQIHQMIHLPVVRSYKMADFTYELKETSHPTWQYVERSDGAIIPLDEANSDYQAYLSTLVSELPDTATKKAK